MGPDRLENPDSFKGSSLEFQVLGNRFVQICQGNQLNTGEMRIIDETYKEWMHELGNPDKKSRILLDKISGHPRNLAILKSIGQISIEYLRQAPTSPVGRFEEKADKN